MQAQQEFESQKVTEELTQAEKEDLEVRRRRAEGTPCTKENFLAWKEKFDAEMAEEDNIEGGVALKDKTNVKKKVKANAINLEEVMAGRLTGFQHFTQKKGALMNFELLEKAAEEAAAGENDFDEELFDDDDDDLDDLDFDDDDDEDDDEDNEEIDI